MDAVARHRFWDPGRRTWVVQVLPGELYATGAPEMITTMLGSCISACMHDPVARVGGLNHFLLPEDPDRSRRSASVRYGRHALERLLDELFALGARRERLETKLFGGGAVLAGVTDVGAANLAFVRRFLRTERLAVLAEDVGRSFARRIRYQPLTGHAQVKRLPVHSAKAVLEREADHARALRGQLPGGTVELL
jgi:chemotaxis protein CheD